MSVDSFIADVEDVLEKILNIAKRLCVVSCSRNIQCILVPRGSEYIAKPRFQPPFMLLEPALKKDFLEIRSKILEFYHEYCEHHEIAWIEEILKPDSQSGPNKTGLLFLLENDVWGCKDVYGDYLIKIHNDSKYSISHFRREEIRNSLVEFKEFGSEDEIKQFVIEDARVQLKHACESRWARIIQDIKDRRFEYEQIIAKYGKFTPTQTLKATFSNGRRLLPTNLFLACVSLGYVAEMWIKGKINDYKMKFYTAITRASEQGIITNSQAILLKSIKKEYNLTKHDANHAIMHNKLIELYANYEQLIGFP